MVAYFDEETLPSFQRGVCRAMQTFEVVSVADGSLWTVRQGHGPALVCCHGGPGLWDYLEPVAAMLDDRWTVYRYDQRSCGRSTGSPPYDVATAVADLDALREHWGLSQWMVLGHSWGATLALAYGLAHPCTGYLEYPFYENALMMFVIRSFPPSPRHRQVSTSSFFAACFRTDIPSSQYRNRRCQTGFFQWMVHVASTEMCYTKLFHPESLLIAHYRRGPSSVSICITCYLA